jgi:hypothetical protein
MNIEIICYLYTFPALCHRFESLAHLRETTSLIKLKHDDSVQA